MKDFKQRSVIKTKTKSKSFCFNARFHLFQALLKSFEEFYFSGSHSRARNRRNEQLSKDKSDRKSYFRCDASGCAVGIAQVASLKVLN